MASEFQRLSDGELARQTQAGSLVAFEELVYRYEDRIYGFVLNWCRNDADAREVTQDTFVRAFQEIGRFDCRRGFAPWLFTIARRKCIDRRRAAPVSAEGPMPELLDDDDPAERLARQEDRQGLWDLARRSLPEIQFQTLWLRYAEEMNVGEIAQVLRKTNTHVKVLLFRARQTLSRELKAAGASGLPTSGAAREAGPLGGATLASFTEDSSGVRLPGALECAGAMAHSETAGARKGSV